MDMDNPLNSEANLTDHWSYIPDIPGPQFVRWVWWVDYVDGSLFFGEASVPVRFVQSCEDVLSQRVGVEGEVFAELWVRTDLLKQPASCLSQVDKQNSSARAR